MPTHRPQSLATGACGRRMPCVVAVLVRAAPTPPLGTRHGPGAVRPSPSGGLHPVSTSVLSMGHSRKRCRTATSGLTIGMKYCNNAPLMAASGATPGADPQRGSGGTW
jgi:hypothetical protein